MTSLGSSAHQCWTAICEREIAWISKYAVPRTEDDPLRQEDSQEDPLSHIRLLKRCIEAAPLMTPPPPMSIGTLWHNYLGFQNILVSEDNNPRIVSIIDWQNTSIGPLYLQFCQPQFLDCVEECERFNKFGYENNRSGTEDNVMDEPPLEVDELRKVYFESISKRCPHGVEALSVPYAELQKGLMWDSERSWRLRNKILSLHHGLLTLWYKWRSFGFKSPPPFSISLEEVDAQIEECKGIDENAKFIEEVTQILGMSYYGEVNVEEYQDKKLLYEDIKRRWIENWSAEWDARTGCKEKINWEDYWPFRYWFSD